MTTLDDRRKQAMRRLRGIGSGWWSAVLGGAAAGALLVPEHRVKAGTFVGSVLLAIALWQEEASDDHDGPCDDCSKKAAAAAADPGTQFADAGGDVNGPAGFPWDGDQEIE